MDCDLGSGIIKVDVDNRGLEEHQADQAVTLIASSQLNLLGSLLLSQLDGQVTII